MIFSNATKRIDMISIETKKKRFVGRRRTGNWKPKKRGRSNFKISNFNEHSVDFHSPEVLQRYIELFLM